MAGIICSLSTDATPIALVAATAKTILQINAPTNQRLKLKRVEATLDAAIYTEFHLMFTTTAGTNTARTPKIVNGATETVQTTGGVNFTAEPTSGNFIESWKNNTGFVSTYALGDEYIVPGGSRIAIRCTAASAVNVVGFILFEE